ncbi:MAG: transposase [Defluviicoccus sp.]|nr:MAG: transposase [Defluviicoccus sp.]
MTKPRRRFTDAFKREAAALLASSGRPLMQIAEELGIQSSMLRNWRNAVGVPAGASRRPEEQATPRRLAGPVISRPRSRGFGGKLSGCAWNEIF